MAITLSKSNIVNGNTIQAADVSQSIDAFTGTIAYDITLSGSLQLTGSVKSRNGYTGSLQGTASIATSASYATSSGNAATVDSNPGRTDSTAYPVVWTNRAPQSPNYSCEAVTIQSSTGKLSATLFSGSGSGLTGTASALSIGGNAATATSASYAVTASYALNGGGGGAAYPTSAYIDNATYGSVGTAYPINASSAGMLYIDTRNNSREVYFAFSAGATNQIVTFTTYWDQTTSVMDPNLIYCTTAGIVYGLNQNTINNTTGKLADLVTGVVPTIGYLWSFQFQYTTVNAILGWYLINVSVA
jgi:hypothetical protein